MSNSNDKRLFWACFIALVTTAFGFIVRAMIMNEWAAQFGLSETQKGEIFGVGLWPFAISIVIFSLAVDRIGYGKAMVFAFLCHLVSAIITIAAPQVLAPADASQSDVEAGQKTGYWLLYIGNFIVALGNGTVEAVINPVVATMFSKEKTKWLNILHAGWPGGLVLGGILAIAMSDPRVAEPLLELGKGFGLASLWQWKVALIFLPMILYALLMLGCKFPIQERVAAGVTYRDMLKEAGILSALIVVGLIVMELARVFGFSKLEIGGKDYGLYVQIGIVLAIAIGFFLYVPALGRPMFVFLVIIMIPLAITELGTDSWITPLMEKEMTALKINAGWVLVYTSFIMMVLRFFAGPIVHAFSPLGLLAISAALAAGGLVGLSYTTGFMILIAATLYGFGKTFFWPTMLGVVSEQFPKGGALTLNMIGGIGMLAVGTVGGPLLGYFQDTYVDAQLKDSNPALHAKVMGDEKQSVFGTYRSLDDKKAGTVDGEEDKKLIEDTKVASQKNSLRKAAAFPVFMFVCYMILIIYFRAKGGYKAVELGAGPPGHS